MAPEPPIVSNPEFKNTIFCNPPQRVGQLVKKYLTIFQSLGPEYKITANAECLSMCPEMEFQDPHRPRSNFERNQSGKMFEFLAVKRYKKSSAGEDSMNDPAIVRSPTILYHTMMYVIEVLIDQDLVPPG